MNRFGSLLLKQHKSITNSNSKGFSLVEVLIVVLLVLALTLIVANGYRSAVRRNLVQSEAINIATRIEQVRSIAEAQRRQVEITPGGPRTGTQYRIRFNYQISGVPCNCMLAEYYKPDTAEWVAEPAVSSVPISLNNKISFGVDTRSPAITNLPTDQPVCSSGPVQAGQNCGSTVQEGEIRFNSRGFPVATNTNPPTAPRAGNAIYINDNNTSYSITVNLLGRIQVWANDRGTSNQWIPISGTGK